MKMSALKNLVLNHTLVELNEAEASIIDDKPLKIEVDGDDPGEQLSHLFGAIWVKNEMENNNTELRQALRLFSQKVRNSIS